LSQSVSAVYHSDDSRARAGHLSSSDPFDIAVPSVALYAIEAQTQIATFLASDGATTIDPDGPAPFFETPTSMVPEDL
jgi:hypothetical protein